MINYFLHKYFLNFIMTHGVIHFQKINCKSGNNLCLQILHIHKRSIVKTSSKQIIMPNVKIHQKFYVLGYLL